MVLKIDRILTFFELIRVKQYIKNLLIFAPCFFGAQLLNLDTFLSLFVAFIGFSFVTSFIYILNDINDKNSDKLHPIKSVRPIASGVVNIKIATIIAIILLFFGLFILQNSILYVLIYLLLNVLYIYLIKKIAILDLISVSIGYVLRLFIGWSVCPQIELSHWIIIMTFLLALFLVSSKRYDDLLQQNQDIRAVLKDYSKQFLTCFMSILVSVIVVAYILYTLSPTVIEFFSCEYLYITSIFVLIGLVRYLQLTIVHQVATSPTTIVYSDNIIKLSILLWILSFICIIYL